MSATYTTAGSCSTMARYLASASSRSRPFSTPLFMMAALSIRSAESFAVFFAFIAAVMSSRMTNVPTSRRTSVRRRIDTAQPPTEARADAIHQWFPFFA